MRYAVGRVSPATEAYHTSCSFGGLAQPMLELGVELLDGVKAGRVFWLEE